MGTSDFNGSVDLLADAMRKVFSTTVGETTNTSEVDGFEGRPKLRDCQMSVCEPEMSDAS